MSLINRVLKDLEARRAAPTSPELSRIGVQPLPRTTKARRVVMLTALLVAVFLGVYLGSFKLPKLSRDVTSLPKPAPSIVTAPQTIVRDESPPSPPAAPTGIDAPVQNEVLPTPAADLRVDYEVARTPSPETGVEPVKATQNSLREARPHQRQRSPSVGTETAKSSPSSAPAPVDSTSGPIEKSMLQASGHEQAEKFLEDGLRAMRKKNLADAQKAFHDAVTADQEFDTARQALVSSLLESGDKVAAEAMAEEGTAHGNARAMFALIAARLKLERGANKEALIGLEAQAESGSRYPDYLALWGNALAREQRQAEAARKYEQAIELAPTNPTYHVGMAYALRNDGQFAAAYAAFQAASDLPNLSPQLSEFVQQQINSLRRLQPSLAKR